MKRLELDRDAITRRLLGVRGHLEGCPGEDDHQHGRIEAYELARPITERVYDDEWDEWHDAVVRREPVTIVRCLECGGQRTFEGELDAVLAEAAEAGR